MRKRRGLPILIMVISCSAAGAYFAAQAIVARMTPGIREDGSVVVTTNQILTPFGLVKRIEGARPKDLAISPNGQKVAVLCNGRVAFFSIAGESLGEVKATTSPVGVSWVNDHECFAAEPGKVNRITQAQGKWAIAGSFELDTDPKGQGSPQVTGLAVDSLKTTLFAALGRRNLVLALRLPDYSRGQTTSLPALQSWQGQAAPYRMISSGATWCISANRGGAVATESEPWADSAGTKVAIDPKTDAALRGSVTFFEQTGATHLPVGRQPSGLDVFEKQLAVACSDDDTVQLVDIAAKKVTKTISLRPPLEPAFGAIPTDLVFNENGSKIFATCGGLNAIAVIDVKAGKVEGFIPTAHFPIAIKRSGSTLVVACSKGFGNRLQDKTTKFGVHDNVGVLQFIKIDEALKELPRLTAQVGRNNRWGTELEARKDQPARPVPERVGEPSVFKHVVYIIKENHTYDVTFGDIKEGNGDPTLCLFPEEVTPNQHALARQFVLLDNTYTSGTNSADGHQWTSTAIANGYIEQNYSANTRSYPYDGGDPLAFSPEGFLWTAATAKNISTRVYGEFVDKPLVRDPATGKAPTFKQLWDAYKSGEDKYEIKADTSQAALRRVLHPRFIGFPSIVSDQWRADQFLSEFRGWEKDGKMPRFSIMLLPNDHTAGTSPGMPTPRAAVADNDLALGRIVEAITKSRFWKETLILVIEDDSQLGLDHVDGHRTIAQVISPYTKRGAVVSEMYNHTSFIRTMGLVLGFPALTRFDRTATPLTACFTDKPNFATFSHIPTNIPLDQLNPPRSQLRGEALEWATKSEKLNWTDVDLADATTVARAVWHSVRGKAPFPTNQFRPNIDEDD